MKVTIRQKSGMQYLYADITVSGIRTKCTLGISVKEGKFNPRIQGVEGESECETNILINDFKSAIMGMIRNLQKTGRLTKPNIVSGVKKIKEQLTNPDYVEETIVYFTDYIKKHIERSKAIRKNNTIKQYNNMLTKIEAYEKLKKTRLTFDNIDYDFYNSYIEYCKTVLNFSTNSIGKHIKNIKMWMNAATEEGLNSNLMFRSKMFKKPNEEADTIYLTEEELQTIKSVKLSLPHLDRVRDLFLIACYTGVRSGDYDKLNKGSIINGSMLKIRTSKTDETVIIPLHPEVKRILEKYHGTPPMISNQKFNEYIKDVCEIAKINQLTSVVRTIGGKKKTITKPKFKFVSSHCARRSFATNAYKAGVPTLAIMAITGHRTEKVFLKYVRISKEEHARMIKEHSFFLGL